MFRIQPGPVVGLFMVSADLSYGEQIAEVALGSERGGCVSWTGSFYLDVLKATALSIVAFLFRSIFKVIAFSCPA